MKRWWLSEKTIEIASDETAVAFRQRPQGESFVFQKINGCRGVRSHVRRRSTHRRHHAGDHDGYSVRLRRKPAVGKTSSYGFIFSTGDAAQKFNAGVTQGGLSSAADAAADKGIDAVLLDVLPRLKVGDSWIKRRMPTLVGLTPALLNGRSSRPLLLCQQCEALPQEYCGPHSRHGHAPHHSAGMSTDVLSDLSCLQI